MSVLIAACSLYVVKTLDGVVDRPYVVVYCHTHVNWLSPNLYSFIHTCHTSLPRKYISNKVAGRHLHHMLSCVVLHCWLGLGTGRT